MTNRVQTLRSNVPGARPAGRLPGELYVNWPDNQLGVIDTTNTAVDLIAVRFFSPLANYALGDFVVQAGRLYRAIGIVAAGPFNPAQWAEVFTSADPSNYLGDNRIINGDMRIDQRNNGASGTAIGYTVDRWVYGASAAGRGTWVRIAALNLAGFPYSLSFTSSGANVPAATDQSIFYQAVEADMISDFAWGTVDAQPVTLSFWARSTLTGTFGGAVQNYAQTRSYPFSYSIPTANTWTKIVLVIPGDMTGTWVMDGNGGAIFLMFDLGSGATVRAPAGVWANGNFVSANGAVSVVAINGAILAMTGVKLEVGSVATPFNRQSLAKSMADCQRYYQSIGVGGEGVHAVSWGTSAAPWSAGTLLFPPMRASPTATQVGASFAGPATAVVSNPISPQSLAIAITQSGAGYSIAAYSLTLSAEL